MAAGGSNISAATPGPNWTARLGVLRHTEFRIVWLAALGSSLGTWMEGTAIQWIVGETTRSSLVMGALAAAQLGPLLMFGLLGGLLADRLDRRKMLLTTQFLMMCVAGTLFGLSAADRSLLTPPVLIGLAAVQGTVLAFNIAAWTTLTPRLVPRADLPRAIALNSLQFNAARMVGPAIAGAVFAAFGPTLLFAINTVSFLGVLGAVWRTSPAPPESTRRRHAVRELFDAFVFVFGQRGPRRVFFGVAAFASLAVPMRHQLPLFVSEVYGLDERTFGVLLGVLGAGAVCGGLLLQWIPSTWPRSVLIPVAITGAGVAIGLFSQAPTVWLGGPLLFLTGIFWLWAFSQSWSAIQLLVPDAMRGRVVSVNTTLMFGLMAVGNLAIGSVGEAIGGASGPSLAVGGAASVLVVIGLGMLIFRTPEIDRDEPDDREEEASGSGAPQSVGLLDTVAEGPEDAGRSSDRTRADTISPA